MLKFNDPIIAELFKESCAIVNEIHNLGLCEPEKRDTLSQRLQWVEVRLDARMNELNKTPTSRPALRVVPHLRLVK